MTICHSEPFKENKHIAAGDISRRASGISLGAAEFHIA